MMYKSLSISHNPFEYESFDIMQKKSVINMNTEPEEPLTVEKERKKVSVHKSVYVLPAHV